MLWICKNKKISLTILVVLLFSGVINLVQAEDPKELEEKISDRQKEIEKLEEDIQRFRSNLKETRAEANSLKKEIEQIDLTGQKLGTEINLTQKQIGGVSQNILGINSDIKTKEEKMADDKIILAKTLRIINEASQSSLPEIIFGEEQFATAWREIDRLSRLNQSVDNHYWSLQDLKTQLEHTKQVKEREKQQLAGLQQQLSDQKVIVDQNKQQKTEVLEVTKNKEANYQQLLADRLEKKRQVENEIAAIEAQMTADIKPGSLPKIGSAPLGWPVVPVVITQYFGNTTFASQHAAVYGGKGHNGVDFDGETGDPIKSAASGVVIGTGDTDATCQGASFGKWVLIGHQDLGLSTLYAHLSLIKIKEGENVSAGQTIGYMGNTGYSTGSHLHFGVYASVGVEVGSLKSKVAGCGTYRLPIASYDSYLNPLSYLPKL